MSEIKSKAEQVEGPRAFALDEAIEIGGLKNERILAYWVPKWKRNFCGMFNHIRPDTRNLALLRNAHEGETAIVISTGPSLDQNLVQLKDAMAAGHEVKILSTSSGVIPCLANGIKPDMALINDGAPWISDLHFKGLTEADIGMVPLVLATTCHKSTAEGWPGPLYFHHDFCPGDSLLGEEGMLQEMLPSIVGIPVGGCTTNLAIRVAVFTGFRRVILLGSDLGFPNRHSHCTKFERDEASEWIPQPKTDQFFRKKARWVYRGCPKGCAFIVHEWTPGMPIEPEDPRFEKCTQCNTPLRHTPTSAEYLFYLRDLVPLSKQRAMIQVDGKDEIVELKLFNSTGDGIATMVPSLPLLEALEA